MIDAELGAANMPTPIPLSAISSGEGPVGEVDRQQQQADEAGAEQQHPGGGEAAGAEPVGQRSPTAGPATRKPAVSGSRKMPAHSGVSA